MKKSLCALFLSAFLVTCGQNTGTNVETGFKVTAGSLTANSVGLTSSVLNIGPTSINCSGVPTVPTTQCYAVITTSVVNSVSYVAIAVQDDPTSPAFNLKIYFEASDIPTSKALNASDVKIKLNGTTYTHSGSETLNFLYNSSNNTYTVSLSNDATLDPGSLNFHITNLIAQKY